jgi:hypothetical protein
MRVAGTTWWQFVLRAYQLYEQQPEGADAVARLGAYGQRWRRWVQAGMPFQWGWRGPGARSDHSRPDPNGAALRTIPVTLCLEPWGEQYTLTPEATFTVIAKGPEGDALEVEWTDDHITLYGWPGSIVTLFHDGKEVGGGTSERTPVPATPRRP